MRIEGAFTGFHDGAVFRLTNGEVWQQSRYRYRYRYAYRPEVEVAREGGHYILRVPSMDDEIEVVRATILCEGTITSDFKGFKHDERFSFDNGQAWAQAESKYSYHYAHRPAGLVIDGRDGVVLSVDGMNDTVRVRRIR